MSKKLVGFIAIFMVMLFVSGCSRNNETTSSGKEKITMWFWGAPARTSRNYEESFS